MSTLSTLLSLKNIDVSCGPYKALEDISLTLNDGGFYAVVGPNGGGKSTFLKLLAGTILPTHGEINCLAFSSKTLAYLPQSTDIDRSFPISVYETVSMGLWHEIGPFGKITSSEENRIWEALVEVGLQDYAHRLLDSLSGGQFQKALFARAAVQKASLFLLDEPFNNLDHPTVEELMNLIHRWHQEGKTIIAVLHDLDLVRRFFPECIFLCHKVIAMGPTSKVMTLSNLRRSYSGTREQIWKDFA